MVVTRTTVSSFAVAAMVLAGAVGAQDYPNRPIRMVTTNPGGSSDIVARITAQGISGPLGQPVIVENRGSGVIPGEYVAKSPPDGYTLLLYNAAVWTPQFFQKVPYDTLRDFAPISHLSRNPQILSVHTSLPVKTVKQLIALAKARPGELNYPSAGNGSSSHVSGELFKSLAGGLKIERIIYKSDANQNADVQSGQIHMIFTGLAATVPLVKAGKLRPLAVTSPQRSPLAPELAPLAEVLPGYEVETHNGLWAPAKTPETIIRRLSQEITRLYGMEAVKKRIFDLGSEPVGSTPEEWDRLIKADIAIKERLAREGVLNPEAK